MPTENEIEPERKHLNGKVCFVTVGSTQFDGLVCFVTNDPTLDALRAIGVTTLIVQCGSGTIPEGFSHTISPIDNRTNSWTGCFKGVQVEIFRYRPSLRNEMIGSDLIIGHAGAGTCLESLELGKPFIAVINDTLMNNHQSELAERLAADGHLLCTTPELLSETLKTRRNELFNLVPLCKSDPGLFLEFIRDNVLMAI